MSCWKEEALRILFRVFHIHIYHSGFHRGGFLGQSHGWILRGLEHRFGFDRWRRLFGLWDPGAVVGADAVAEQLTDQILLVAFSVGRGNDFQANNRGAHRLTEHFLGSGRKRRRGTEEVWLDKWVDHTITHDYTQSVAINL